ncbi:926_t:CDS:2 [Funneliformis mosseae]|uniref:926_t:CDS:1 n=1 Tax=Funneliformis mosseae TaxID=27381 RepID=A0A9N9CCT8_FUNMO|nr:926_t:CDS:2 [Funneliformis mosseae]
MESQLYTGKQHAGGGLETYLLKDISGDYLYTFNAGYNGHTPVGHNGHTPDISGDCLHTSNTGHNSHTPVGIRILDTSIQGEALKHTCSRTFLKTSTKHLTQDIMAIRQTFLETSTKHPTQDIMAIRQ